MEGAKRKIAAENTDLLRQLQVMENSANMLSMLKLTLADQLDKARAVAENEALGEADMLRCEVREGGSRQGRGARDGQAKDAGLSTRGRFHR